MQRLDIEVSLSPEQIAAKSIAEKLGVVNEDVAHILKSPEICKAIIILSNAGLFKKYVLSRDIIYSDSKPKLIIFLAELNLEEFYDKALADYTFAYQALQILQQPYKNEITADMLKSNAAIDVLLIIKDSVDDFAGFKILFSEGLIVDPKKNPFIQDKAIGNPPFYKAVRLMKENGLTKNLKLLVDNPQICYAINTLLTPYEEVGKNHVYALCTVLNEAAPNERMTFVSKSITTPNLKKIHADKDLWNDIKLTLINNENKLALNKLIYTPEELVAKEILSNVKMTIKETSWPNELSDPINSHWTGKDFIKVPFSVNPQACSLWNSSSRNESPVTKLEKVKALGKKEGAARLNAASSVKHYLFGKSATAMYFDSFVTEEAFNNKFGLGKK